MVEFGLVGPAAIAMICAILEFSGIMFVQTILEGGAREASRYAITGAVPEGLTREEMIQLIIEDNSFGVINPDDVEMTTLVYDNFSDVGQPEPFTDQNGNGSHDQGEPFTDANGNGAWDADMGAAGLGGPGDVVVYQLTYDWSIMIPLFQPFFGDEITLEAHVAVRNEPFEE